VSARRQRGVTHASILQRRLHGFFRSITNVIIDRQGLSDLPATREEFHVVRSGVELWSGVEQSRDYGVVLSS
jgi:hypothetical protein